MDQITNNYRIREWTEVIRECAESRQTKRDWCDQHGINIKTFYYWQRKVRQAFADEGRFPAVDVDPKFVQLVAPGYDNDTCRTSERTGILPAAMIMQDRMTIILSNDAETAFLQRLIGVLKDD